MDFRRSAARRRRVMREDVLEVESATNVSPSPAQFQRYRLEEVLSRQPLTVDAYPKQFYWVAGLVLALFAFGSFSVGAHYQVWRLPLAEAAEAESGSRVSDDFASILANRELWSLHVSGSFSQLFLITIGVANCFWIRQIYLLRRHRGDDYHGRYQLWLWLAPVAMLLAVANVPAVARMCELMYQASGASAYRVALRSLVFFAALVGVIAIAIRGFWEVRESWLSVTFLMVASLAAIGSWALAPSSPLGLETLPLFAQWPADIGQALWLLACVSYLSSLMFYLSFVHRDVLGLLSYPSKSGKVNEKEEAISRKRSARKIGTTESARHESSEDQTPDLLGNPSQALSADEEDHVQSSAGDDQTAGQMDSDAGEQQQTSATLRSRRKRRQAA